MIKTTTSTKDVPFKIADSTFAIDDNLHFVHRTATIKVGEKDYEIEKFKINAVVDRDNMKLALSNAEFKTYDPRNEFFKRAGSPVHPLMMTKEAIERIRSEGNLFEVVGLWERLENEKMLVRTNKLRSVIDDKRYDLVFGSTSTHELFDMQGKLLPFPVDYDYTTGSVDNAHYDLTELYNVLKQSEEFTFFQTDSNYRKAQKVDTSRVAAPISPIPYYNESRGRTHQLILKWIPSHDTWDRCLSVYEGYLTSLGQRGLGDDFRAFIKDLGNVAGALGLDLSSAVRKVQDDGEEYHEDSGSFSP